MDPAFLTLRWLLAGVFGLAGSGKLRDRAGFRETLRAFGAPGAGGLALLVPAAEAATAVLLVPAATARAGGFAAAAVLLVVTLAVAWNLARGRAPACRCFGQRTPAPIDAATLARNAALFVAALLVAHGPAPSARAVVAAFGASAPAGWAALAAPALVVLALAGLGWAALRLHERQGALARRVEQLAGEMALAAPARPADLAAGVPPGSPAPAFDLPLLAGDRTSVARVTASGRPAVLVFTSSHCPSCAELWPDIGRWQRDLADRLTVLAVGTGSAPALEMKLMGTGVRDVALADGTPVADTYRIAGIPSAVVVAPDGTIASETVLGPAAVRALVARHAG